MGTLLTYTLQSAIVMTFLYLGYKLLLAPTTFHRMNRWIIVAIYLVSWALPAFMPLMIPTGQSGASGAVTVEIPQLVGFVEATADNARGFDWYRLSIWFYMSGMVVVALSVIYGAMRMARIIRSGRHLRYKDHTLVITSSTPGPFNWGRYVVVSESDLDDNKELVLNHELEHKRLGHWFDLIPAQLTTVLQWYSPAAWLLMRELRDVHEFSVDQAVCVKDPVSYQMMLIKKTAGTRLPIFADSLNHSQINKRITMMMTKKSKSVQRVAALALPAVAALAVLTLTQPVVANVLDTMSSTAIADSEKQDYKDTYSKEELQEFISEWKNKLTADEKSGNANSPEVAIADENAGDAGSEDLATAASAETETEADSQTKEKEQAGKSDSAKGDYVVFVNGKEFTGHLSDIDNSTIVRMDIDKSDPKYPNGKIMITTGKKDQAMTNQDIKPAVAVERLAEFEGGQTALMSFLGNTVRWPANAEAPNGTIRAIVQFTINADGTVSDARVMRPTSEAFDAEAIRVVNATSGKWTPAESDGKKVASKFTLPITFKQQSTPSEK